MGSREEHLFILNPRSFPRRPDLDRVLSHIAAAFDFPGAPPRGIHISRYPRDAISIIRKRIARLDPETRVRVYAVGGDGISFDCLNGIVDIPNAELAIIPYGSGNDFIRSFGNEYYEAFRDISLQIRSPAIPTDIIHCGNNCALNFCCVGLEAGAVIKALSLNKRFEKLRFLVPPLNGFFYTLGGILETFDKHIIARHYEINADGINFSGLYSILGGKYDKYPEIFFLRRVKKVFIRSEEPLLINLDGEVFFDSDLTIEILPEAVKVGALNTPGYRKKAEFHGS
jgi:diacylglycerol kinase family enzyme